MTFSARPTPQHSLPVAASSPTNLSELRPVLKPGTALPATLTGHSESSVATPRPHSPVTGGAPSPETPLSAPPQAPARRSSSVLSLQRFSASSGPSHAPAAAPTARHGQALPLGGLEPSDRPRGRISFSRTPVTASQEAAGSGRPFLLFSPLHQRNRDGSDRLQMGFFFPGRLGSQS